jgi:hypothetical protein
MHNGTPPIFDRGGTQVDHPKVRETGCDHETQKPLRIGDVALVEVKSTAFLI